MARWLKSQLLKKLQKRWLPKKPRRSNSQRGGLMGSPPRLLFTTMKKAKSTVNSAGNYTKPAMRKRLFNKIKAGSKGGDAGEWSARKAQLLASEYKKAGGGYK